MRAAKAFFIYDQSNNFRSNNVWFRTRVKSKVLLYKYPKVDNSEQFVPCLVMLPNSGSQHVGLILPRQVAFTTHVVTLPNQEKVNARLMVKVSEISDPIDPLSFRFGEQGLTNECCFFTFSWSLILLLLFFLSRF